MDRAIGVMLLLLCGIVIGAGGSQMWGWYRYTAAINAELSMRGERDQLVTQLADARNNRDKAQRNARQDRMATYVADAGAKAWAASRMPDVLAKRVRDAARSAESAASSASASVPNDAKGAHANR